MALIPAELTETIPTDSIPAAEFIIRHLYRPFDLGDNESFFAVTETAGMVDGDDWVWTDDNAKVLEFLSRPEIWRRFPEQTSEVLRFLQFMCQGPFMFRRLSAPRLELAEVKGADTRYTHSLMHVSYNLARGLVVIGIRFHDIRTAYNLPLTGNRVEFSYEGRRFTLPVEEAISESDAVHDGHALRLRHTSELHFTPRKQKLKLGRISYVYTISSRSMLIEVEATLEIDPAIDVADIVITIGHDQLSHGANDVRYNTVAAHIPGGQNASLAAGEPGRYRVPASGADYYSIAQAEIAGFALAIHSRPRSPELLTGLDVVVRDRGQVHYVTARYEFPGPRRGARLVVVEDKLLTAGGFYGRIADYAELMREARAAKPHRRAALDYSISYDYGAEINSFAKCFAVCVADPIAADSRQLAEQLQAMFDRYVEYYIELFVSGHYKGQNTIMSRQLAFVILAVVTMYRVTSTERYLDWLKRLCDVLLDFEVRFAGVAGEPASGFPYGMGTHRSAFVDGHSASLLALTQASRYLTDPRFATAIDRGLHSYCIETCKIDIGQPVKIDVLSTTIGDGNGNRHTENAYWNFNVGLALRFFGALRNSPVPALQAIAAQHRDRLELLEMVMRWQLRRSITERDDLVEIRTSVYSGETNSETQPWVMLGLLGHPYD
jgi:hypothetical protein